MTTHKFCYHRSLNFAFTISICQQNYLQFRRYLPIPITFKIYWRFGNLEKWISYSESGFIIKMPHKNATLFKSTAISCWIAFTLKIHDRLLPKFKNAVKMRSITNKQYWVNSIHWMTIRNHFLNSRMSFECIFHPKYSLVTNSSFKSWYNFENKTLPSETKS